MVCTCHRTGVSRLGVWRVPVSVRVPVGLARSQLGHGALSGCLDPRCCPSVGSDVVANVATPQSAPWWKPFQLEVRRQ